MTNDEAWILGLLVYSGIWNGGFISHLPAQSRSGENTDLDFKF